MQVTEDVASNHTKVTLSTKRKYGSVSSAATVSPTNLRSSTETTSISSRSDLLPSTTVMKSSRSWLAK